jgi:phage replication O-like protein O
MTTDNVVLINPRGFTRMDNSLMDALMVIDLPGRELKVALFIAKATINFQAGPVRIKATEVSKSTNLHPDVVSKAISHLLKRRVIFREGGARGDIGLCEPKEWIYVECPNRINRSDSDQMSRVVKFVSQTKTDDSLLYSKKQTPIPLPTEEGMPPLVENESPKAERKAPFGKAAMLADNPHGLDESLIADYLAVRKLKRAPVSARIWTTLNTKLGQCEAFGVTAADAITIAIDNGWQGFEVEWVTRRASKSTPAAQHRTEPDFDDTRWAENLMVPQ